MHNCIIIADQTVCFGYKTRIRTELNCLHGTRIFTSHGSFGEHQSLYNKI